MSKALNKRRFTIYALILAVGALVSQLIWMGHLWDSLTIRELVATWPDHDRLEWLATATTLVQDGAIYSTFGFALAVMAVICWSVAQWRKEPVWRSIPLAFLGFYLLVLVVRM